MTYAMNENTEVKHWTAKRKVELVKEIIPRKTSGSSAARAHDLKPSEVQQCVDDAGVSMENDLRASS